MKSREAILLRLKRRRETPRVRPGWAVPSRGEADLAESFENNLRAAGGTLTYVEHPEGLDKAIEAAYPQVGAILDTRQPPSNTLDPRDSRELTILAGTFGVAENGAVWVEWPEAYPRSLLTLSERLALILPRDRILSTMQEAYESLDLCGVAYGIFLAGPSKTADIEQALVIGAHGAMEMRVFLV
jgi:L-lactate dehydrogenase complex protein LldG